MSVWDVSTRFCKVTFEIQFLYLGNLELKKGRNYSVFVKVAANLSSTGSANSSRNCLGNSAPGMVSRFRGILKERKMTASGMVSRFRGILKDKN
jgi:hypothetical protein